MTRRRKCRHCGQLYEPDPRNRYHQRYCSQPTCRQASKTASQRRWRASPKGKDYFRGAANRQRVKAWRQAHPGYWRKQRQTSRALQDHCPTQVLVPPTDESTLSSRALQDLICTQGLALTGLVAHLTGSALQENIASTTRRLIRLGREIQGPASGRPADGGDQACAVPPNEVAAHVAVVPQDTPPDTPFTAGQIVELGRYAHRQGWTGDRIVDGELVARCLKRVGVDGLADRPFAQLSGGERQRVVVARALAQLGTYLLLDEPSTHLDITHQLDLYRLLREVASEGIGIVMICHDLFLAPLFIDRALLLDRGRVFGAGPPRTVLAPEHLGQVYGSRLSVVWSSERQVSVALPSDS